MQTEYVAVFSTLSPRCITPSEKKYDTQVVDTYPARYRFEMNSHVTTCLISACLANDDISAALNVYWGAAVARPERVQYSSQQKRRSGLVDEKSVTTLLRGLLRCTMGGEEHAADYGMSVGAQVFAHGCTRRASAVVEVMQDALGRGIFLMADRKGRRRHGDGSSQRDLQSFHDVIYAYLHYLCARGLLVGCVANAARAGNSTGDSTCRSVFQDATRARSTRHAAVVGAAPLVQRNAGNAQGDGYNWVRHWELLVASAHNTVHQLRQSGYDVDGILRHGQHGYVEHAHTEPSIMAHNHIHAMGRMPWASSSSDGRRSSQGHNTQATWSHVSTSGTQACQLRELPRDMRGHV